MSNQVSVNNVSYWDMRISSINPPEQAYKNKINNILELMKKQLQLTTGKEWLLGLFSPEWFMYKTDRRFAFVKDILGSDCKDCTFKIKFLIIRLSQAGLWSNFRAGLKELQDVQKKSAEVNGKINLPSYGIEERKTDLDAVVKWMQFDTEIFESLLEFELNQNKYCRDEEKANEFNDISLECSTLQELERKAKAKSLLIKKALQLTTGEEDRYLKEFRADELPSLKEALDEAEKLADEKDKHLKKHHSISDLGQKRRKSERLQFSVKLLEDIQKNGAPSLLLKDPLNLPGGFENFEKLFQEPLEKKMSQFHSKLAQCFMEIEILKKEETPAFYIGELRALFRTLIESCYILNTQLLLDVVEQSITGRINKTDPADRKVKGQALSKKMASEQTQHIKSLYEFGFQDRFRHFLLDRVEWNVESENIYSNCKIPKIISYYLAVARPGGKCVHLKLTLDLLMLKIQTEKEQRFVAKFIMLFIDKPFLTEESINEFVSSMRKESPIGDDRFPLLVQIAKNFKGKFELGLSKILMIVNNPKIEIKNIKNLDGIRIIGDEKLQEMGATLQRLSEKVMQLLFRDRSSPIISYYQAKINDIIRPLVESERIEGFEHFLDVCVKTRENSSQLVEERLDGQVYSAAEEALMEAYFDCVQTQPIYPHLDLAPLLKALREVCLPNGMAWLPDMFSLANNPKPVKGHRSYESYIAPREALAKQLLKHPYHEQAYIDEYNGFIKTGLFTWHRAYWQEGKIPGKWTLNIAGAIPGYHCIEIGIDLDLTSLGSLNEMKIGKIFDFLEEECGMAGSASKRRMTIELSPHAKLQRKKELEALHIEFDKLSVIVKEFSANFLRSLNILSTRLGDPSTCDYTHVDLTEKFLKLSSKIAFEELKNEGWNPHTSNANERYFHQEVKDKMLKDPEAARHLFILMQAIKRHKDHPSDEYIIRNVNPALESLLKYLDGKQFSKQNLQMLSKRLSEMIYGKIVKSISPIIIDEDDE